MEQPMSERQRLATAIETWLAANDPQMAAALARHPHRAAIVDRAAATAATSLERGALIRSDPTSAETRGDQFYLLEHPEGLEAAVVATLAGSRDYWRTQMQYAEILDGLA
jgi:hypothetical protein